MKSKIFFSLLTAFGLAATMVLSGGCSNRAKDRGKIKGHEWVDLGLSVKWATCNIGASSPLDYGNYYAWGETEPKEEYTEENSVTREKNIGGIAGNPKYDAARANWGGSWRLPKAKEIEELVNMCEWEWVTQEETNGYEITGPNGNSIFLPAAGYRSGSSFDGAGEGGNYWSATPYEDDTGSAYFLTFNGGGFYRGWGLRYGGLSVRPVTE